MPIATLRGEPFPTVIDLEKLEPMEETFVSLGDYLFSSYKK
jgi:hypothetical protein